MSAPIFSEDQATELADIMAGSFMVVNATIRNWPAMVNSRKLAEEVTENHGAAKGTAKVRVSLFPNQSGVELREAQSALRDIGSYVERNTMLLGETVQDAGSKRTGLRIVSAQQFMEFAKHIHALNTQVQKLRQDFYNVYDQRVQQALQQNLGTMVTASDYPTADQMMGKLQAKVKFDTLPASTDFERVTMLPANVAAALGKSKVRDTRNAIEGAMRDLQTKMLNQLNRITEQLGKHGKGEKTSLFGTLTSHLKDQVRMMREANVTNNEQLEQLCQEIESKLLSRTVKQYKASPPAAADAAREAAQLATVVEDIQWF